MASYVNANDGKGFDVNRWLLEEMLSEPATSSSTLAISHGNNEQNDHASNPSYLSQSGASTSGLRHEYSTPNIAPRYHATNSLHPVDLITEPTSALATATSSQDPGEWDWKSVFTSNRSYAFTTLSPPVPESHMSLEDILSDRHYSESGPSRSGPPSSRHAPYGAAMRQTRTRYFSPTSTNTTPDQMSPVSYNTGTLSGSGTPSSFGSEASTPVIPHHVFGIQGQWFQPNPMHPIPGPSSAPPSTTLLQEPALPTGNDGGLKPVKAKKNSGKVTRRRFNDENWCRIGDCRFFSDVRGQTKKHRLTHFDGKHKCANPTCITPPFARWDALVRHRKQSKSGCQTYSLPARANSEPWIGQLVPFNPQVYLVPPEVVARMSAPLEASQL